jgi:hypothetical protein
MEERERPQYLEAMSHGCTLVLLRPPYAGTLLATKEVMYRHTVGVAAVFSFWPS